MSEDAKMAEVAAPSASKLAIFWVLLLLNIVLLSVFWFLNSAGDFAYVLVRVLFGALLIPAFFVLVSQVSKKARNSAARIDVFILVSVFVFAMAAIPIYAKFVI